MKAKQKRRILIIVESCKRCPKCCNRKQEMTLAGLLDIWQQRYEPKVSSEYYCEEKSPYTDCDIDKIAWIPVEVYKNGLIADFCPLEILKDDSHD